MYENLYPLDAPPKARALLIDDDRNLLCLARIKPHQARYYVTVGGKLEAGETTAQALARELLEEIDATAVIGRPLLTLLDTTYHVARLVQLGDQPFTGPEFADPRFGRYELARVPLSEATAPGFDLQPRQVKGFLYNYAGAVLAEAARLKA